MQGPVEQYWQKRLEDVRKRLEENHFEVFIAQTAAEAKDQILNNLMPHLKPRIVSWGGSVTIGATGVMEVILANPDLTVINPYEKGIRPEEGYERRRQGLLADLFLAGTNALTENGQLVNLDLTGNRVGAIHFGPKHVILAIGRNKLVPDLDTAMTRVKEYAAPVNAMRLGRKTPCATTSFCEDCKSADRICSVWTITEKCYPRQRIKIILINQDLGF